MPEDESRPTAFDKAFPAGNMPFKINEIPKTCCLISLIFFPVGIVVLLFFDFPAVGEALCVLSFIVAILSWIGGLHRCYVCSARLSLEGRDHKHIHIRELGGKEKPLCGICVLDIDRREVPSTMDNSSFFMGKYLFAAAWIVVAISLIFSGIGDGFLAGVVMLLMAFGWILKTISD